jgi:hypothetical protein
MKKIWMLFLFLLATHQVWGMPLPPPVMETETYVMKILPNQTVTGSANIDPSIPLFTVDGVILVKAKGNTTRGICDAQTALDEAHWRIKNISMGGGAVKGTATIHWQYTMHNPL